MSLHPALSDKAYLGPNGCTAAYPFPSTVRVLPTELVPGLGFAVPWHCSGACPSCISSYFHCLCLLLTVLVILSFLFLPSACHFCLDCSYHVYSLLNDLKFFFVPSFLLFLPHPEFCAGSWLRAGPARQSDGFPTARTNGWAPVG